MASALNFAPHLTPYNTTRPYTLKINLSGFYSVQHFDFFGESQTLRWNVHHQKIRSVDMEHQISNGEARQTAFGRSKSRSIDELITLHRLCWLGHVLRKPVDRLSRRDHFAQLRKRHGLVGPSVALVHPSYYFQCIAPVPTQPPALNSPLTVLYLRTNLSASAYNAWLLTAPSQLIGERNCGSCNHCTTSRWLLRLMIMMMMMTMGGRRDNHYL
ncbi:hypothetical protein T265_14232, partial [Opisthorchis viverrini]